MKKNSPRSYSSELASTSKLAAGLYLVATPIGNLGDITLRALEALKSADGILCEDTRVTGTLLQHYGIKNSMAVYNDHSGDTARQHIIRDLEAGKSLALVSDAGTPMISDPGYKLVNAAREKGIPVFAVPGSCAAVAALSVSGLPTDRFLFIGFLPAKRQARQQILREIKPIRATLIFYERASRVLSALEDMQILGNRACVLARELTKRYEEVRRFSLRELPAFAELRGECVLLVSPPEDEEITNEQIEALLRSFLKEHRLKEAVAMVVDALGCQRNRTYEIAVKMKDE